ncbi:MAG: hypothetical protein H6963_06590 [Chromatiaceae bacterium]|nr:hypothetical protein [Chromatiaceae bacterium]
MNRWAPITSVKIRILVIALTLPWAITCSAQYRDRPAEPDACDAKLRDTMVLRISTPKDYGKVKGTSQAVTGEIVDYFDILDATIQVDNHPEELIELQEQEPASGLLLRAARTRIGQILDAVSKSHCELTGLLAAPGERAPVVRRFLHTVDLLHTGQHRITLKARNAAGYVYIRQLKVTLE